MAVDYRKIPTRKDIEGDFAVGSKYIGRAMTMLHNLERNMQFQGVKQLSDHWTNGEVTIEAWHGFGLSRVRISVKGGAVPKKQKMCPECMCGCHISTGVVAYTEKIDCIEHIRELQLTYDVIVCQKKTRYIELTGCQPTDFTRYADGDLVYILWVPDAPLTYADNMTGGCVMSVSSWGRILPFNVLGGKFIQKPC